MKYYNISLIGAGNVATELALRLESAGHSIHEITSGSQESASKLASRLYHTSAVEKEAFDLSTPDIIIICVPDSAIEEVLEAFVFEPHCLILHTSGNTSIEIFDENIPHHGILYPLQTFNQSIRNEFDIPFCLEANNSSAYKVLEGLARSISDRVYAYSSEERQVLHVAAVMSTNFSNRLIRIAKVLCSDHGIEFDILKPVIAEMMTRSMEMDSDEILTGPAKRNDISTLRSHNLFLNDYPEEQKIYQVVTDYILKQFAKEKT